MTELTEPEKELVVQNEKLIWWFCMKHKLKSDDWYGTFAEALCHAAQSFNPEKSRFSTWGTRYLQYAWGNACAVSNRKMRTVSSIESLNEQAFSNGSSCECLELIPDEDTAAYYELLDFLRGLSKEEKIILKGLIYREKESVLLKKLGGKISISTLRRRRKKLRERIAAFINNDERKA